jgi:phage gpG-like protein
VSAKNRVTVKGVDIQELGRRLGDLRKYRVVVGVQGTEATETYDEKGEKNARPLTLVEVAAVHEFGTEDGRIPERSFLRGTLDRKSKPYGKLLAAAVSGALEAVGEDGLGDVAGAFERGLNLLGLRVVADVQTTIRDSGPGWPPNAPMTIARKGSSKPLIDTGRLRQSIRHAVRVMS